MGHGYDLWGNLFSYWNVRTHKINKHESWALHRKNDLAFERCKGNTVFSPGQRTLSKYVLLRIKIGVRSTSRIVGCLHIVVSGENGYVRSNSGVNVASVTSWAISLLGRPHRQMHCYTLNGNNAFPRLHKLVYVAITWNPLDKKLRNWHRDGMFVGMTICGILNCYLLTLYNIYKIYTFHTCSSQYRYSSTLLDVRLRTRQEFILWNSDHETSDLYLYCCHIHTWDT